MLVTWRTKSSGLEFFWLLSYVVDAYVYSSNEEYFRDFRGFKMDQGLGLLLLNGLEWFEMGNNQPLTFCIFTF